MTELRLHRLGQIMEPEAGNAAEVEGVLNPAAARGPDGHLYLFPRVVAKGNYSRVGIARVRFDDAGDPIGVERLGFALEPEADYELRVNGGGCEDPRVGFVEPLGAYVMTYTANSDRGPRIAVAVSKDLFHWERRGLVKFGPFDRMGFENVDNKDASVFPAAVPDVAGRPALAMLHRPLFPGARPEARACDPVVNEPDVHRECIWIAYHTLDNGGDADAAYPPDLCDFANHRLLAAPVAPWERMKIGGGTPPVMTRHGWMILYHGVSEVPATSPGARKLSYSAGVMILSAADPGVILYRSPTPALSPELPAERQGTVANVVFPTGIDRRDDLGRPDRFDVYYGMADNRIGVARLDLPERLDTTPPT